MGISDKIKDLRIARHMSVRDLAQKAGVTYESVRQWEAGIGAPKRTRLEKVAEALGVSVRDLVAPDHEDKYPPMRKEARALIETMVNLASENLLDDATIETVRTILSRFTGQHTPPPTPQRRESDWVTGRPGAATKSDGKRERQ